VSLNKPLITYSLCVMNSKLAELKSIKC
jgi:hypothetical protein